jgi:hypothetical protein
MDYQSRRERGISKETPNIEELAISGIHMLFAADMCTVYVIHIRGNQITVQINTGFSLAFRSHI